MPPPPVSEVTAAPLTDEAAVPGLETDEDGSRVVHPTRAAKAPEEFAP